MPACDACLWRFFVAVFSPAIMIGEKTALAEYSSDETPLVRFYFDRNMPDVGKFFPCKLRIRPCLKIALFHDFSINRVDCFLSRSTMADRARTMCADVMPDRSAPPLMAALARRQRPATKNLPGYASWFIA